MANISRVPLNIPEAYYAADLGGIKNDLDWILHVCEMLKTNQLNPYVLEAFSISIIIKYGRCNKGGVRKRIPEEIVKAFSEQEASLHSKLIDLRDKFIAHSVNEMEENWLVVDVDGLETEDPKIKNLGFHHDTYIFPFTISEVNEIIMFINKIITEIDKKIECEKKIVKGIIGKIPIKEIIKHDYCKTKKFSELNLHKNRERKTIIKNV